MSNSRARLEPNFDEWKHVVKYYKDHYCAPDEELPDFEAVITASKLEQEIIAGIPGDAAKDQVRKLYEGGHRYANRLLPTRLTDDAPGGLFQRIRNDEGEEAWRMADFLVAKLNTLKKRRGMQVQTLSSLWKGQGVSKDDKGHQVIRAIFREVLGPVERSEWTTAAVFSQVIPFRRFREADLRSIISQYNYTGGVDSLCKGSSRPGALWSWAPLVKRESKHGPDEFMLNFSDWFNPSNLKANLDITNLYDDDWANLVDHCFHADGRQENNEPAYRNPMSIQRQLEAVDGAGHRGDRPTERQSRRILANIAQQRAPNFSSKPVGDQRALKLEVQRVIDQAIATLAVGYNRNNGPKAALRAIAIVYGTCDGNEEMPTAD